LPTIRKDYTKKNLKIEIVKKEKPPVWQATRGVRFQGTKDLILQRAQGLKD